ncbi:dehydrogenase reductase [Fusarium beomiforme]|uniref:3beta-hydroxysteroid 3-dehydrogenase n=1 Tax=Fusarium beomiforme TaxID=44412 RepID=A0A9P5DWK4_9HYPO|nr:dehydrogenase reductase [Fusarium beomiforme]
MSSSQGTILVTGTNGGLGSAIVTNILGKPELARNYTGVYTVRKAAMATRLQQVLKSAPDYHRHDVLDLDLGSLAGVRTMTTEIDRRVAAGDLPPIRALILNAGYQDHEEISMSEDGYEMSWQVNFLANQLLTLLLVQSMDKENGRILLIGSWSYDVNDERNNTNIECYKGYDSLFPGPEELAKGVWSRPDSGGGRLTGYRRYGILAPVISLQARFKPNGEFRPLWKSAEDAVQLTFETKGQPGKLLYLNGTDELETGKEARDDTKRKALWRYGLEAAGIEQGDTFLNRWQ